MSSYSVSVGFDTERSQAAPFSGSFQTLGSTFTQNPTVLVFDNQSTVSVEVSVDGVNTWKTFSTGEAFVLDLRANHGIASDYSILLNTQFYVRGTAGTGNFFLSSIFAR